MSQIYSAMWDVVVAVEDGDPRTLQRDGSELFAVYPGLQEFVEEGSIEKSSGYTCEQYASQNKSNTNLMTPGGVGSSSIAGSFDANANVHGDALTQRRVTRSLMGSAIQIYQYPTDQSHVTSLSHT